MSSQVIFYDLPSKQGTAWSLNPWKTRLVLNYKNIDYKTEWIEYPDLASKLKSFGIPPNDRNHPDYKTDYSIPAIKYPDGTYQMDSWPIAHTLESLYPSPSLHLSNPIVIKIRDHIPNIMKPLTGFTIPKAPTKLLNPRAAEYFNETRKERFGMSLVEVEEKTATDEKWEEARKPVMEAADWLKSSGGPFFLGETVSYADFIFVGMMHMMKRMDEEVFQRFLEFDPVFGKLYEACEPWLKKDD